jgi:hypothetical protein
MKRFMIVLVLCVLIGITYTTAQAGTDQEPIIVNVDLSKLPDNLRNQVIAEMNTKNNTADVIEKVLVDTENVTKYMNTFAVGLKEVCSVLSIEVNEFIKTPVGMITTGIVLYKVLDVDSGAIITYFKELFLLSPCGIVILFLTWRWNTRIMYGWTEVCPVYDDKGKKTKEKKYVTHEEKYSNYDSEEKSIIVILTCVYSLAGIVILLMGIM